MLGRKPSAAMKLERALSAVLLVAAVRGQMIGDRWREITSKCPFAQFEALAAQVDAKCCPAASGAAAASPNICRCVDGTPKSGAACTQDGARMCLKCDAGYQLNVIHSACTETGVPIFEARIGAGVLTGKHAVTPPPAVYEFKIVQLSSKKPKGSYSSLMRARCKLYRMKPVCDHPVYCMTDPLSLYIGQKSHLSHPEYYQRKGWVPKGFDVVAHKWDNLCSYTGHANGQNALCNTRANTHQWKSPRRCACM
jgi:hypothetical protein